MSDIKKIKDEYLDKLSGDLNLEKVNQNNLVEGDQEKKVSLPGTDKAQDFGSAPGYEKTSSLPKTQQTQSIESAGTVMVFAK